MIGITIYAPIVVDLVNWATDQSMNLDTKEIRINFMSNEVELYDYESGIIESTRPLNYFTPD